VSKADKILQLTQKNPLDWRIDSLKTVAGAYQILNGDNAVQVTSFLYALMVGRYRFLLIGQLNRYTSRNLLIL